MISIKLSYIVLGGIILWSVIHNIDYLYKLIQHKMDTSMCDKSTQTYTSMCDKSTQSDKKTRDNQVQATVNLSDYVVVEYCPRV